MKTWISDSFPLERLECPYFDICRDYRPSNDRHGVCSYTYPCELRQWFREVIEPYVAKANIHFQVKLIREEDGKKKRKN